MLISIPESCCMPLVSPSTCSRYIFISLHCVVTSWKEGNYELILFDVCKVLFAVARTVGWCTQVTMSYCSLVLTTVYVLSQGQNLPLSNAPIYLDWLSSHHVFLCVVVFDFCILYFSMRKWREMISESTQKIGRPRQLYTVSATHCMQNKHAIEHSMHPSSR